MKIIILSVVVFLVGFVLQQLIEAWMVKRKLKALKREADAKKEDRAEWEVYVGNIGRVGGGNESYARALFVEYQLMSLRQYGSAANEIVTLMRGDEVVKEHIPHVD